MDDRQKPNRSEYAAVNLEGGTRKTDSGDPEEVPTNGRLDDNELEELLKSNEKRTLVYLGSVFWIMVIIVVGAVVGTLMSGNGAGGRVMLRADIFLQNNAASNRWLGFEMGGDEIMVTGDDGAQIWKIKNPNAEDDNDDEDCVRFGQPVVIEHEEVLQSLYFYPLETSPAGCHLQTITERTREQYSGDRWIIRSSLENAEERLGNCVLYNQPFYIQHEQSQDVYLESGAVNHAAEVTLIEEDQYLLNECVRFRYEWIIKEDQETGSTIRGNDENEECRPIPYSHVFESKEDLQEGIRSYCNDEAIAADLYGDAFFWDVCGVTDMSSLFRDGDEELCVPEDITEWDVSSVTDFSGMFSDITTFDQDISGWNVGSGIDFSNMFSNASAFNQDISDWDVSSGTTFHRMFQNAVAFNQDISGWDIRAGRHLDFMFSGARAFSQNLSTWTETKNSEPDSGCRYSPTLCPCVHSWCSCNSFYNKADLEHALNNIGAAASMYGDPKCWDVSAITDMSGLFRDNGSGIPEDITEWDVSSVTDFSFMFSGATTFNQDIGDWNVGAGTDFSYMFWNASAFDANIGDWDVSSGFTFEGMFSETVFNQDVGRWNVSSGYDFTEMFAAATAFNQDIGSWDVSFGRHFEYMFYPAFAFNQSLRNWDVSLGRNFDRIFSRSNIHQQLPEWTERLENEQGDCNDIWPNHCPSCDATQVVYCSSDNCPGPWQVHNLFQCPRPYD